MKINWLFIRGFLQYFLPMVLVVIIISTLIFEYRNNSELQMLKRRETDKIQLIKESFENEFDSIISDLMIITENEGLKNIFSSNEPKQYSLIAKELMTICKWKKNYDQLRLIGENGKELVRVNIKNDECTIVDNLNLQDKSERYYFKETIKLNAANVYISPFDLNVENGKIEYPLKPVIRFSTPVFDKEKNKKGIIVINYLGNKILNKINEISTGSMGEISIINKEGYWLHSPNPEEEWGFMFTDGINKTFKNQFPESWNLISMNDTGQFENNNGIFYYQNIVPLHTNEQNVKIANKDNQWKIISRIGPDTIQQTAYSIFTDFIIYNIYVLLLIVIVSFLLARARIRKLKIDAFTKDKERLQGVLEMAGAISHEINQPLQIISTYVDLLTHPDNKKKNLEKTLIKIADQTARIGKISKKLTKITKYETRDYLKGVKIIDIDKSSGIMN